MLTFFRRIRKGLLEGGSISKYLLYAIGEIALVVIGILIAVSINNQNNDRKERIAEQKLLQSLLTEYRANLSTTQFMWIASRGLEIHLHDLLAMIGSEETISEIDFIDKIGMLYSVPYIEFDLSISKATINSGKQSIIQNEPLKHNLQLMMPAAERIYETYSQLKEVVNKMKTDPTLSVTFRSRELRFPSGYGDAGPSKFQTDLRGLLSEPIFESYLENLRTTNAGLLTNCFYAHSNFRQSIMELEAELTKRFDLRFPEEPTYSEPLFFPFTDYNQPLAIYRVWGSPLYPRWRNFKDSLSIEFRANNEWGGFSVEFGNKLNGDRFGWDYSKYSRIRLILRTKDGRSEILLGLKDTDDEDGNSGEEAVLKISDQWQTFEVELDQYASFDPKKFNYLKLIYSNQAAMNLYVKQIEFLE